MRRRSSISSWIVMLMRACSPEYFFSGPRAPSHEIPHALSSYTRSEVISSTSLDIHSLARLIFLGCFPDLPVWKSSHYVHFHSAWQIFLQIAPCSAGEQEISLCAIKQFGGRQIGESVSAKMVPRIIVAAFASLLMTATGVAAQTTAPEYGQCMSHPTFRYDRELNFLKGGGSGWPGPTTCPTE